MKREREREREREKGREREREKERESRKDARKCSYLVDVFMLFFHSSILNFFHADVPAPPSSLPPSAGAKSRDLAIPSRQSQCQEQPQLYCHHVRPSPLYLSPFSKISTNYLLCAPSYRSSFSLPALLVASPNNFSASLQTFPPFLSCSFLGVYTPLQVRGR